jgi:hypothetical protein
MRILPVGLIVLMLSVRLCGLFIEPQVLLSTVVPGEIVMHAQRIILSAAGV